MKPTVAASRRISAFVLFSFACVFLFSALAKGQTQSGNTDTREPNPRTPYSDRTTDDSNPTSAIQRQNAPGGTLSSLGTRGRQNRVSDTVLSADRIVEILRNHPELLPSVKRIVLNRLRQQGESVPTDLSPEDVYGQLESDRELRTTLTQLLAAEGYVSDENSLSSETGVDRWGTNDAEDTNEMGEQERISIDGGTKGELPPSRDRRRLNTRLSDDESDQPKSERAQKEDETSEKATFRKRNPYPGLQSLRDLYAQVPAQDAPVKRFGADVFRMRGMGTLDTSSMDLPAGPEYVLGPGDYINIALWGGVSQRFARTVDREGRIAVLDAGMIEVAGKTIGNAQQIMQQMLTPYYNNIHVDISLSRVRTIRVYVVGDVQRPGAYEVSSLSTPLNALYAAGGPTARGSLRKISQLRGTQVVREIDLYKFLLHGIRLDADRLEAGDTILVPPVGPQVTVAGMVRRPAIYELRAEKDLADVVDLAGGLLVTAALGQVKVERVEAHERRAMLSVDLPDGSTLQDLRKLLGPLGAQDGDRISISPIAPYLSEVVYVQGHVTHPGKYPFRKGMDVGALLKSYNDVLPEPADHAEVIRLQPPDYRPQVIEFHLGEVLDKSDPVELQPLDTVRIFGRYEMDAPKVFVYGEVLRPGEYPQSDGMTAASLVRMAGGFKRSALTDTADVASYVVQNGQKVKTSHVSVDIAKALAGDSKADAVLKPGDVVSIRQLTGWKDIGASVVINGEVRYPGTYGIEEDERLSSVLKRAGGFRETAYAAGAMVERIEVREFAEKSRAELIHRIETTGVNMKMVAGLPGQEQSSAAQMMMQQQQQVLTALRQQPATGRLVIKISPEIEQWRNTSADIELRAGDVIVIPKRPNFVLVNGQVYSPSAINYTPGKNASWYLQQAGGPTEFANRGNVFIIRANGSVVAGGRGQGFWNHGVLSATLHPGDTLVVPEKIVGGTTLWKNLINVAQVTSSLAVAARIATSF